MSTTHEETGQLAGNKKLVDLALASVRVTPEGRNRLIDFADEFRDDFIDLIKKYSNANRYREELVAPTNGYGADFTGPKVIFLQAQTQRIHFPVFKNYTGDDKFSFQASTRPMEGFYLLPHWLRIARNYSEAVNAVVEALAATRPVRQLYQTQVNTGQLFETSRKKRRLADIRRTQAPHGEPILPIVECQFGLQRAGSVRGSRIAVTKGEFCLGVYETGMMLLTHPERLQSHEDLDINCGGDVLMVDGEERCMYWTINVDGVLTLDMCNINDASGCSGNPTGRAPALNKR